MRFLSRRVGVLLVLLLVGIASSAQAQARPTDIVYVTRTGAKYHRQYCRSLSHSKIPMTLKEASC
jgi:hypothetical protein